MCVSVCVFVREGERGGKRERGGRERDYTSSSYNTCALFFIGFCSALGLDTLIIFFGRGWLFLKNCTDLLILVHCMC